LLSSWYLHSNDLPCGTKSEFQSARTEHQRTILQRQINALDRQIDNLVYDLYDLTEEEIKIVEKSEL
jgi:hypothetical protein